MVLTKCKVGKEIEKTIAENRFFYSQRLFSHTKL